MEGSPGGGAQWEGGREREREIRIGGGAWGEGGVSENPMEACHVGEGQPGRIQRQDQQGCSAILSKGRHLHLRPAILAEGEAIGFKGTARKHRAPPLPLTTPPS